MSVEKERIIKILDSFSSLTKKEISNNRINYYCKDSIVRRKVVITQISHTGNGYIRCGHLEKYKDRADKNGYICIKNMSEDELRNITREAIEALL